MILEALIRAFGAHTVGVLADVFVLVPVLWALFKVSYQNVTGRPVPRSALVTVIDVVVELMNNAPGAVNRAWRLRGGASLFRVPDRQRPTHAPPVPPSMMGLLVFALLASCSPVRSAIIDINHTLPRRGSCGGRAVDTEWCEGRVPMVCVVDEENSSVARAWPLYGLNNDHRPAECATACVATSSEAQCEGRQNHE